MDPLCCCVPDLCAKGFVQKVSFGKESTGTVAFVESQFDPCCRNAKWKSLFNPIDDALLHAVQQKLSTKTGC